MQPFQSLSSTNCGGTLILLSLLLIPMGEYPGGEDEAVCISEVADGSESLPIGVLELDHVYDALGHPRRRYLCYSLLEDTEWSLMELAKKVAAWEQGIPEEKVTELQHERVYISLYHSHVPKLVDLGVISFDPKRELIRHAENAEQVLAALEGVGASLESQLEAHARTELTHMDEDDQLNGDDELDGDDE
jgi:hypothetical protein